eukprot:CAMPEP_0203018932 /NCGR_PEP_ID=MMETSP1401-20130829/24950_1 /ASSEMBLY_ACC=CAM_ASM_000894 /TAXON_ID=38833 /ORGANISM="Micromonas pusilla, Strain CCAC1681" /LENGTH=158 /DNA_ID=CAMNT_0049760679 /DNA_START=65 /DNA_END=538 /DNA_ORIENTATION=+
MSLRAHGDGVFYRRDHGVHDQGHVHQHALLGGFAGAPHDERARAAVDILDGGDDLAHGDERARLALRVRLQERHGEPRLQRVHALRQREGQVLAGSRQAVRPLEHRAHEHRLVDGRGKFRRAQLRGFGRGAGDERASRGDAASGGAGGGRERDACAER